MPSEFVVAVGSGGQATIPLEVLQHLGLTSTDRIAFVIDDDGSVRLQSLLDQDIDALRGAAGILDEPCSWQEVVEIAYEDRFGDRYAPSSVEPIDLHSQRQALAELNASYAKLAADPVAWANWQAEMKSYEGTLMDGLEDDPWSE